MKMIYKLAGFFLIMMCYLNISFAGLGSSGAQFLQIGSGIRAISMGSAYVGIAEGLDALYWNPAGLSGLSNNIYIGFNHVDYFAGINYESIALSMPLMGGVFGVSAVGLLSGDIEITTVEMPDGTDEFYSANDYSFGITYSRKLTNKFSTGLTLKLINQNIDELSATGWAFDLGATYKTGLLKNLRLGFVITNFGPDLSYGGDDLVFRTSVYPDEIAQEKDARAEYIPEKFQLPLKIQFGLAMDLVSSEHHNLVISFDVINPSDQKEKFGVGMEYIAFNVLSLRGGYTTLNDKNYSAGMGLIIGPKNTGHLEVDYGYENHQYLGDLHRFGLVMAF